MVSEFPRSDPIHAAVRGGRGTLGGTGQGGGQGGGRWAGPQKQQLLGNWDPQFLLQRGILGPNSLIVVYVDPLGNLISY